jgi:hypothetical protein
MTLYRQISVTHIRRKAEKASGRRTKPGFTIHNLTMEYLQIELKPANYRLVVEGSWSLDLERYR